MRALGAWLVVALVMGLFIEWGFRLDQHEWEQQLRRNAEWRALAAR
jgi:hypothetical protein